jgi:hypothetical protein
MSDLTYRSSRFVWRWCLAYTAPTPRAVRERRRAEMSNHLWESERAGLSPRHVMRAAMAGVRDDVGWAAGSGFAALARSFRTPTPYVVIAALFPIQGAISSGVTRYPLSSRLAGLGWFGGMAMLCAAAVAWLLQRRRP